MRHFIAVAVRYARFQPPPVLLEKKESLWRLLFGVTELDAATETTEALVEATGLQPEKIEVVGLYSPAALVFVETYTAGYAGKEAPVCSGRWPWPWAPDRSLLLDPLTRTLLNYRRLGVAEGLLPRDTTEYLDCTRKFFVFAKWNPKSP